MTHARECSDSQRKFVAQGQNLVQGGISQHKADLFYLITFFVSIFFSSNLVIPMEMEVEEIHL